MKRIHALLAAASVAFLVSAPPLHAGADIVIVNTNAEGVGFNDPTPAEPVGGNEGTTIGAQRLLAFQEAASLWGATLDSNVTIYIQSAFQPLSCTATSAVLGSAGAIQVFANVAQSSQPPALFPGSQYLNTWEPVALANKRAGADLAPGPNGTSADDIIAFFNSSLGQPGCLTGIGWYYGFDGNHGADIDLVTVLLHEFGHGLGFATYMNKSTGALLGGYPDVYLHYLYDTSTDMAFTAMTNTERKASVISPRRVALTGPAVTAAVPAVLAYGTPLLRVNSPYSDVYPVGLAAFGPSLSSPGVTGDVAIATDPADVAGPSTTDACSAITNDLTGKIALVDRGTCGFVVKAKNCQNAGAIGVIVADSAAGGPPGGMSGVDPTITIPSVRIQLLDGNALKVALLSSAVNVTMGIDMSVRAGATPDGLPLVYSPNPVVTGSSISHWDTIAFPNQLMEPNISADLTHLVEPPTDMTLPLLRDVGWFPDPDFDGIVDDQCPNSIFESTVTIQGCDTGVTNTFSTTTGCSLSDRVAACAATAADHDEFVACVAHLTNSLKKGALSKKDKVAILNCAAKSTLP